jgi:ATP phosphoribosyltransferase
MQKDKIVVALPKGRLFDKTIEIFKYAGLIENQISQKSRKLILEEGNFKFLIVRAKDVPTYVENGIADIGVAGDDVLLEQTPDVYKPIDLGIGVCGIVVAGKKGTKDKYLSNYTYLKIATKYPNITKDFFAKKGVKVHIIELYGSVELAPLMGLADYIVDIVETGRTLRENGLEVIEYIRNSSAKLIVNRISYKTKNDEILNILEKIEKIQNNN